MGPTTRAPARSPLLTWFLACCGHSAQAEAADAIAINMRPLAAHLQLLLLSCLLHLLLLAPPPADAKGSHCTGERSSDVVTTYTFTAPDQVAQLNTTSFTLDSEWFDLDSGAGLYHIWAVDVTQPDGTSGLAAYVQEVCSTGLPATPTVNTTPVSGIQLEVWFSFSDLGISSTKVCPRGPQPRYYFLAITREDEVRVRIACRGCIGEEWHGTAPWGTEPVSFQLVTWLRIGLHVQACLRQGVCATVRQLLAWAALCTSWGSCLRTWYSTSQGPLAHACLCRACGHTGRHRRS